MQACMGECMLVRTAGMRMQLLISMEDQRLGSLRTVTEWSGALGGEHGCGPGAAHTVRCFT